jgi:hypothetical protein
VTNIVLVNNVSRDRRVLKLVLVIRAIKKYFSILGCHLTQPKIGQKVVLVIFEDEVRAARYRSLFRFYWLSHDLGYP